VVIWDLDLNQANLNFEWRYEFDEFETELIWNRIVLDMIIVNNVAIFNVIISYTIYIII